MATYFKYAERSADSFVNWAEIGKNISDTLREEARIREEKKAAIDKATRDYGEQLANAPQGENRDVNRWTLNFADEAQQARLLQDRLLKSGMLKLKDYNIQRQNLTDGTKNLFNLSKEYQEEYKLKMERMKSADPKTRSQALESYLMSTVEGFANFSESKALINPTDYTVGVGMLKKNPETGVMEVTGETATVNSLKNRIKSKFDYFDVDDANKSISGRLAEYVKAEIQRGSSTKAGFVITTEDAMKRPGYQKALDEAIDSFLVTPYNTSSVLTNSIGIEQSTGKAFSFTYSEEEAKKNKNLILLKTVNDMPVPQFTKEQTEAVKSFMKGQIEQQIKFDQKINPYAEPRPERPTQYEYMRADEIREQKNAIGAWNNIFFETDPEKKKQFGYQVVGTQRAQKAGLIDLDFTQDEVLNGVPTGRKTITFKYVDPTKDRTIAYDPSKINLKTWAKLGNEVHGIDDVTKALAGAGGGDPNLVMGSGRSNFTGVRASRQGPQATTQVMTPEQQRDLMKLEAAKNAKDLGYKYDWNTGTVIPK
jgi:hypothetical protein